MLKAKNLHKTFIMSRTEQVRAVDNISYSFEQGSWAVINGPSGSGKTTFLSLLATLDRPNKGEVIFDEKIISSLPEENQALLRKKQFGIVCQDFQLFDQLNAWENIALPLVVDDLSLRERKKRATTILTSLGLTDRATHLPCQMSGGERQRIALGRALVSSPTILFADEPTSNIDAATVDQIIDILRSLNNRGCTIITVSHDQELLQQAGRIVELD